MSESTDFMHLAAGHVDDSLDAESQRRLADAIEADAVACKALALQVVVDCMLRPELSKTIDVNTVMRDVLRSSVPANIDISSLPTIDVDKIMRDVLSSEIPEKIKVDSATTTERKFLSIRSQRKIRALPKRKRSLMPSRWLGPLAAIVLISCVLTLAISYMNRNTANRGVIAATVQDGTGVVWGNPPRVKDSNRIAQNTLVLRTGVAEISLPSGATIIIEGPTVIELTGMNQARLSQGRASAHVPPQAIGFTLVSEDLTVIDRGTAFGLSRSADKRVQLHVFTGMVEAQSNSAHAPLTVNANSAVQSDPQTGALTPIPCKPLHFYRELRPRELSLDVADMVAGGDGRGSGVADGIDPRSGELVSSPSLADIIGDGQYHRVKQAPDIDGVFIPRDNQAITSQGHHFVFPPTNGKGYDLLRRGGIKTPIGPLFITIPAVFDGIDYHSPDHTILGMHANCGFTIDLTAIAHNHPGMFTERFTGRVANFREELPDQCLADFWVIIDGIMVKRFRDMTPRKAAEHIDVLIPVGSRYLTLVATDSNKDNRYDCVNVGDPKLHLRALP
jgi:NPCBM/NEW2 domain